MFNPRLGIPLTALVTAFCLGTAGPSTAARPNIVFILLDDLGWTDFGIYGSKVYETPHIDALAATGMRFTQAYSASPVCSPTRSALLTGKYPARTGITDYSAGSKRGILTPPEQAKHLDPAELTLAEAFRQAGYATGFIGKWHLGGGADGDPRLPEGHGFDSNIGGDSLGSPGTYFSPYKIHRITNGPKGEYLTDRLSTEAVNFIEAHKGSPFYLQLSHYSPHLPLGAKSGLKDKYTRKISNMKFTTPRWARQDGYDWRLRQDHATYAAMIESIDIGVGRIVKKLKDVGLEENTLIIVTSDNGGYTTRGDGIATGATSNKPLRAGKGWLYEGGHRVPLIVKWPPAIPANRVSDAVVTSTDFYPTLLEAAGLPAENLQTVDGKSFFSALQGDTTYARGPVYWHYPHYHNSGGLPGGGVRDGDYKLVEFFEDNRIELYNLKEDPAESLNLATALPAKAQELRSLLHDWRGQVGARMPLGMP